MWARGRGLLLSAALTALADEMICGDGVVVCGVLALQTGLGPDLYAHPAPAVHGIWPEVAPYGSSACLAPSLSDANTSVVYSCYAGLTCPNCDDDDTGDPALAFEAHEWGKHGVCAGVRDADDFFSQLCGLAKYPLDIMTSARAAGADFAGIASAVSSQFSVFSVDNSTAQILLSACVTPKSGFWVLSPVAEFPAVCGAVGVPT